MRRKAAQTGHHTPTGQAVPLGRELGRGRSGVVYEHGADAALAVKLWHAPSNDDAVRLRAMLEVLFDPRPAGRPLVICWPLDAVLDGPGRLVGFIMPAAVGIDPQKLALFLIPRERERLVKNLRYDILVNIAATLADAVDFLHRQGVVLGDLNDMNLLISADAVVSVLDCDSMQFTARDGTAHISDYHRPEYLAPECAGVDLAKVPRTVASDTYALTSIIFQLLMGGFHPFAAVVVSGSDSTQAQRAAAGEFAYAPSAANLRPPPGAPPFSVLPGDVGAAFTHTFRAGAQADRRVPLAQLAAVLRDGLSRLTRCAGRPVHLYPANLGVCPWCQRATHGGATPGLLHATQPPLNVAASGGAQRLAHVAQPPFRVPGSSARPAHAAQPPLHRGQSGVGAAGTGQGPGSAGGRHAAQPSILDTIRGRGAASVPPQSAPERARQPAGGVPPAGAGTPASHAHPPTGPQGGSRAPAPSAGWAPPVAYRSKPEWRPGGRSPSEWAKFVEQQLIVAWLWLRGLPRPRVAVALVVVALLLIVGLQGCGGTTAAGGAPLRPNVTDVPAPARLAAIALASSTAARAQRISRGGNGLGDTPFPDERGPR
jgi:hypothetical protein